MTLQRSCKIIHFPFFLYPTLTDFHHPVFFNPWPGVTSHPGHCYRFYWARSIQTICMHRCFIKRIVSTATATKTMTSTTSKGETGVALARVWIFLLFSVSTPPEGEKTRLGFRRSRREREQRGYIRDEKENFTPRCITLTLPPTLKTYRWINEMILRYAWLRRDIIPSPQFDDFVRLLAFLILPRIFRCLLLLLFIAVQTTGEPVIGRGTYEGFSWRERESGEEGEKKREEEGGWRRFTTKTFSSVGFAGKTR